MQAASIIRNGLIVAAAVTIGSLGALIGLVAAVDAGHFRGALIHILAARIGRPIEVHGKLEAHLLSSHPSVVAERVDIDNPPWMPSGLTVEAKKVSVEATPPRIGEPIGIVRLEMQGADFHLVRDSRGHANWQLTDPDARDNTLSPILRDLSIPDAHVVLEDELRHLKFKGKVSARQVIDKDSTPTVQISGAGVLNGQEASFEVTGDSLASASHERPYHFVFAEHSSGSHLRGHGYLPRPFDFDLIDASFDAAGEDLKDLFYLTGVTLIDTGAYKLSGKLARRGNRTKFSDLVAHSGQSDVQGGVTVDSSSGRPNIDFDLSSQFLRLADLGARAAGRADASEANPPLLVSDAVLNPNIVRADDATVNFHAHRLQVDRVLLAGLSAKARMDHGVLKVDPLLADVLGGKLVAHATLDARPTTPADALDLKISDLQLGLIGAQGSAQPPFQGALQARLTVTGHGSSLHQFAASANGTLTAVLPQGAIRESLAEMTGIDLRGLGLLLTKSMQEANIRCGVADFKAHDGTLTAQRIILDTDPVLIVGEGQIHLDSETLDLMLRGHPKKLRLFRLRSPVLLRGTLSHPAIDIGSQRVLQVIDPGHTKDADCAALLAAAEANEERSSMPPARH
jgi:AsmA family protein